MTEGPLWIDDAAGGHLLFSDIPANAIYKWTPDGELSVYMEEAGYTGDDILNAGAQSTSGRRHIILIGPNGLTLDPRGRLLIAAMADRAVVRIEADGSRTVLADRFDGGCVDLSVGAPSVTSPAEAVAALPASGADRG